MSLIAPTLQQFFTGYLIGQKDASTHTIAAYRDVWRLLLGYLDNHHHLRPSTIDFTDLDAETITGFLAYLETIRGNSARTRNARLAAIHSFFAYAAYRHPEHAEVIRHVLALKGKNTTKAQICYLTDDEVDALLDAPLSIGWVGERDRLIILALVSTGLRVSELTHLSWVDVQLTRPAHVAVHGKGRKDRITPLGSTAQQAFQDWRHRNISASVDASVFPSQGTARAMTSGAVERRLHLHASRAAGPCPSLRSKNVTPHVLRHTTAMRMLAAGIDIATISLWMGHASIDSTSAYIQGDLGMKQRALDRTAQPDSIPGRYVPADSLLEFLENL